MASTYGQCLYIYIYIYIYISSNHGDKLVAIV